MRIKCESQVKGINLGIRSIQMIFKAISLDGITTEGSVDRGKGQELSLEARQHLTVRYSNEDQEASSITEERRRCIVLDLGLAN